MYVLHDVLSTLQAFCVALNGTHVEASIQDMSDGSYLVGLNASSYVMHAKEDSICLRITIDGMTHVFETENDPSQLRTTMPGKLLKYLVEDGAHVTKGEPYAEIEVMKMCMTLSATESGCCRFSKMPGASLTAGDIMGNSNSRIRT